MRKKALVFIPENPYPPQSGVQHRYLEIVAGLRALGAEVVLAGSTLPGNGRWDRAAVDKLKAAVGCELKLYEATADDHRFIERLSKFYELDYRSIPVVRRLYPLGRREPPINSMVYSPPGKRRWFDDLIETEGADLVLMNYAYWDGLINHRKRQSVLRVIDTIDLVTLSLQRWRFLEKYFSASSIAADSVPEEVLEEDIFQRHNFVVRPKEFRIYDQYSYTIAIAPQEAEQIRKNTCRTKVLYLPMTQKPVYPGNDYQGPALMTTGPNPFNIQGYFYFIKKVLPLVTKKEPSFLVQVTGSSSERVQAVEGVELIGFVPDLQSVYQSARFLVCPIFGGTGQQVKIVEAMAHGLAVVALRAAAERSPLRHGENGLVADNAFEFAECVLELWKDAELCRRLGNAARETIAQEFSNTRLTEGLSEIVCS